MCRKRRQGRTRRHPRLPPMTGLPRKKRYQPFGSNFINRQREFVWNTGG